MVLEQVSVEDTCIATFRNIIKTGKNVSPSMSSKCNDLSSVLIGCVYVQVIMLCQFLIT